MAYADDWRESEFTGTDPVAERLEREEPKMEARFGALLTLGTQPSTRLLRNASAGTCATLEFHADTGFHLERERTMTTLQNRQNNALLVVDIQNAVVERAHKRDAVVANILSLVEKARRERIPVVWVQHSDEQLQSGSDAWRIVPELIPDNAEPLIEKHYGDSFEATNLESVLSGLGVGRLIVPGAQTDACIRSTTHGAFVRGYDVTLVSDAHTTEDHPAWGAPPPEHVIAHTNLWTG